MSVKILAVVLAVILVSSSSATRRSHGPDNFHDLLLELEGTKSEVTTTCFKNEDEKFNNVTETLGAEAQKLSKTLATINDTFEIPAERFSGGFAQLGTDFWPQVIDGNHNPALDVYITFSTSGAGLQNLISNANDKHSSPDLENAVKTLKDLLERWKEEEKGMAERIYDCITAGGA